MKRKILSLALLAISHLSLAQLNFGSPQTVPGFGLGYRVECGDVDGDGDADAILVTQNPGGIIMLRNELGILSDKPVMVKPVSLDLGLDTDYYLFALGNFDNDGRKEIAVHQINTTAITILKYQDGVFADVKTIATPTFGFNSLQAADLNKDGVDDIIGVGGGTSVYLSTVNGSLPRTDVLTPEISEYRAQVADMNGDTWPDLILSDIGFKIAIYQNKGGSAFEFWRSIGTTGNGVQNIIAEDFNGDQKKDLLVVNANTESVEYLTQSDTGFNSSQVQIGANAIEAVGVFDINSDGKPDALFSAIWTDGITFDGYCVLKSSGSGFTSFLAKQEPLSARQTLLANIDADNKIDLVTLNGGGGNIFVSEFQNESLIIKQSAAFSHSSIARFVSDLNKDGIDDVIRGNIDGSLSITYGNSSGEYETPTFLYSNATIHTITATDFNNDGINDIAFSVSQRNALGSIKVMLGNNLGKFGPPVDVSNIRTNTLITADFDADGNDDLFTEAAFLFGNGDGTFSETYHSLANVYKAVTADYNKDGFDDVIVSSPSGLTMLKGKNAKSFDTGGNYITSSNGTLQSLQKGDVNNDGFVDIVAVGDNGSIFAYLNQNNSLVEKPVVYTGNAIDLAVADFDLDGNLDIAICNNSQTPSIDFLVGHGNSTFDKQTSYPSNFFYQIFPINQGQDAFPDLVCFGGNSNFEVMQNDITVEPAESAKALAFQKITDKTMKATFQAGSGNGRLVTIRKSSTLLVNPTDNIALTANTKWGAGGDLGQGNYVAANGDVLEIEITDLEQDTEYSLAVFEFNANNDNSKIDFKITAPLTGTFKTKKEQTITAGVVNAKTDGDPSFNLNVSASSQLPVKIEVTKGSVSVNGLVVSISGPGPVVLKATQEGDLNYAEAPPIDISFCVNPKTPVVTVNQILSDITLSSSSATKNQWYAGETLIAGATNQTYKPTADGVYSVKVDFEGCSSTSAPTANLITGFEKPQGFSLSIHPNPASQSIHINWDGPAIQHLKIWDALGKELPAQTEGNEINISSFHPGMYLLVLETEGGTLVRKFIKQR